MQLFRETLTIANGQAASNELNLELGGSARLVTINIKAPPVLEGVVKVYISDVHGGTYVKQHSNGQDIPIPQDVATLMSPLVAGALRLVADTPQAGDKVFQIVGELEQ